MSYNHDTSGLNQGLDAEGDSPATGHIGEVTGKRGGEGDGWLPKGRHEADRSDVALA
jgi:hypothetical protein